MTCCCGVPLTFMRLFYAGMLREETVCTDCGRFWIAYRATDMPTGDEAAQTTVLTKLPAAPDYR